MQETTVSIDTNNFKKWDPNQEGQRFKDFLNLKKDDESLDENQISDQSSQILSLCMEPTLNLEKFRSQVLL